MGSQPSGEREKISYLIEQDTEHKNYAVVNLRQTYFFWMNADERGWGDDHDCTGWDEKWDRNVPRFGKPTGPPATWQQIRSKPIGYEFKLSFSPYSPSGQCEHWLVKIEKKSKKTIMVNEIDTYTKTNRTLKKRRSKRNSKQARRRK